MSAADLTPHQLDILAAYGREGRIRDAADSLGISDQTLKNALSEVYRILGVKSIAAALWKVYIEPPQS